MLKRRTFIISAISQYNTLSRVKFCQKRFFTFDQSSGLSSPLIIVLRIGSAPYSNFSSYKTTWFRNLELETKIYGQSAIGFKKKKKKDSGSVLRVYIFVLPPSVNSNLSMGSDWREVEPL